MAAGEENVEPRIWDVVRVPFPYTNRPVRQHRPALVVAAPDKLDNPGLLWVLMITSAQNRGWAGDVEISAPRAAGLPVPSLVRTEKIATIETCHATPIGQLSPEDRRLVAARLRKILADAAEPGK